MKLALSVNEAASAVGLSVWTIRKYIANKKIRATRLAGCRRVLIEPSEISRLLEEGRDQSKEKENNDSRE